jgi:hypothetical protein
VKKLLAVSMFFVVLAASILVAFTVGQKTQLQADPTPAAFVCTYRPTEIRESPTGYIIVRVASGSQVIIDRIDAPFAYVSYFDGKQWIEGTVTASYLGVCGMNEKESL